MTCAVILGCWCLLCLDQAEMQDSEDAVLLEHPTELANTWKRGSVSVFGAIGVIAGETISLSPLESLRGCELFQPPTGTKHLAHTWITQTSLDRRRLV